MWHRVLLVLVIVVAPVLSWFVLIPATPVKATTTADIVVTATPDIGGSAPSGFTLTFVDDFQVDIDWTKGSPAIPEPPGTDSTIVNTIIRVRWGEIPADRTDGYQVYYGDADNFSDTSIDLTSLTQTPYYRAWSETVFYDIDGDIISNVWEETGVWEEANFMSISWFAMILLFAALGLTCTMFITKQTVIGFAAALFWALFGGYIYTLSVTAWDIYFLVAFGSLLGMVTFTALAAYGLREKRDTLGDESMEKGEETYVDEKPEKKEKTFYEDDGIPELDDSLRPRRKRTLIRAKPKRKGEFDF